MTEEQRLDLSERLARIRDKLLVDRAMAEEQMSGGYPVASDALHALGLSMKLVDYQHEAIQVLMSIVDHLLRDPEVANAQKD